MGTSVNKLPRLAASLSWPFQSEDHCPNQDATHQELIERAGKEDVPSHLSQKAALLKAFHRLCSRPGCSRKEQPRRIGWSKFKCCSKCRKCWYCSEHCQKLHWKAGHK